MSSGQSSSSLTYDDMGRLVKEVTDGITKEYDYSADGQRTSFTVKANNNPLLAQTYSYTKQGQLSQVFADGNLAANYQYDANGRMKSAVYENGTSTEYTYTRGSQIKQVANKSGTTVLSNFAYHYFADGNIKSIADAAGLTSYQYDTSSRLRQVTTPGNDVTSFEYDDYGNRHKMNVIAGGIAAESLYQYDKNNRLLEVGKTEASQVSKTLSSYDSNGNLRYTAEEGIRPVSPESAFNGLFDIDGIETGEAVVHEYNAANQLVGVRGGGANATYTYNADGLRMSKTIDGVTIKHVWDGQNLVLELEADNSVIRKYVRGNNLLQAIDAQGAKTYYLHNGHGDVVQLANASGTVVRSYEYDAFGNLLNEDPADWNPFRYTGEYYDKETSTYYLRARSYDPGIGRFMVEDTYEGQINEPLSLNLYTYTYYNPLIFHDPTGHFVFLLAVPLAPLAVEATLFTGAAVAMIIAEYKSKSYVSQQTKVEEKSYVSQQPVKEKKSTVSQQEKVNQDPIVSQQQKVKQEPIVSQQQKVKQEPNIQLNTSGIPAQGPVVGPYQNVPAVDAGNQGKHIVGHPNQPAANRDSLWISGTDSIRITQEAWMNGQVVKDNNGEIVKVYNTGVAVGRNGETKVKVHYNPSKNQIHGYPVR